MLNSKIENLDAKYNEAYVRKDFKTAKQLLEEIAVLRGYDTEVYNCTGTDKYNIAKAGSTTDSCFFCISHFLFLCTANARVMAAKTAANAAGSGTFTFR